MSQEESVLRIKRAAIGLFADRGFDGVSVQQIADRSAVSKANIFHHFQNKKVLYIETLKQAVIDMSGILNAGRLGEVNLTFADLKPFLQQYLVTMHANPRVTKLIFREVDEGDDDVIQALAEEIFKDMLNQLTTMVKDGIAQGILRAEISPTLAALSLLSLVKQYFHGQRVLHHLVDEPFATQPDIFIDMIYALFLQGAQA